MVRISLELGSQKTGNEASPYWVIFEGTWQTTERGPADDAHYVS